jgi:alkanesulfonate monooxygenase SsuD/methylene tetrahydromethanopterin reductase-like flavin-dependent oxidoreductase (luciferase family)
MITTFSSLYAGHIDLGDMGQDATPANERRYSNEQLMTVFSKSAALAKTMDRLDYDTLWFAEYHFQHFPYESGSGLPGMRPRRSISRTIKSCFAFRRRQRRTNSSRSSSWLMASRSWGHSLSSRGVPSRDWGGAPVGRWA